MSRTIFYSNIFSGKIKSMDNDTKKTCTDEQLSLIEINLNLSIDERINQLQSAVNLIEEMRNAINENRF